MKRSTSGALEFCETVRVKTTLKVSILLNLSFAACLFWILGIARLSKRSVSHLQVERAALEVPAAAALHASFRWSQLESSDYRVYVANLRRIGCPEKTLRDIIAADVESLYTAKRQELHFEEDNNGPWSHREAAQLVAFLLGEAPSTAKALTDYAVTSGADSAVQSLNDSTRYQARVPLVLRAVDTSALELEPEQREAIEQLREEFVARMDGRNPTDPAYRQLWEKAQSEVDDALAGTIGRRAYLELESAAGADASPE